MTFIKEIEAAFGGQIVPTNETSVVIHLHKDCTAMIEVVGEEYNATIWFTSRSRCVEQSVFHFREQSINDIRESIRRAIISECSALRELTDVMIMSHDMLMYTPKTRVAAK